MTANKVYSKIVEFAFQEITQNEFEGMLRDTSASNTMWIYWKKLDGDRTMREMYWGKYAGGAASITRSQRDELALISETNNGEYRTIQLNQVTLIRYNGKTYTVK